jgi:tight adherence protein C
METSVALGILVFSSVALGALALLLPRESALQSRLRLYSEAPNGRAESAPLRHWVLAPVLTRLRGYSDRLGLLQANDDLRFRLARAGLPAAADQKRFLSTRLSLALGLLALASLAILSGTSANPLAPLLVVALAGLGWQLPSLWLSRRIDTRQLQMVRSLPDALDLIVVSVEAGHGLEAALQIVSTKLKGPLSQEIERTLQEMMVGKPRRDALRALAKRTDVPDLQLFIAAIVQADQLGVSIAQVLRVQAEAQRVRRRQRAEEQAAKAPVKMLLPLVTCIFPSLMIMILGPVAVGLMALFSASKPP